MAQTQTNVAKPVTNITHSNTEANSPSWQQLTSRQKQALAPLGAQWSALTAQQQRKWLTISQNFSQLSASEQTTMHTRMADWVALSPQQRNVARYNFNTLQNLPKEDKKAKWEAYQALSVEEKRLLSAESTAPTKSAAPTAKPLESRRLVHPAVHPADASRSVNATTIDRKTLLPRPSTLAVPKQTVPAGSSETAPDTARNATETAPS
ncbi:DUF3106 domain-containing protein [Limnohabitans sp. T6-5]|uniref:DUF3106 domain-containing protein n=1 Tax=Limnohabitans sp. T6-5 TaxID=1100724 RepID=UPI001304A64F|nr:DUF3106 domain-containing protein [Limnohabitans sp. T6-5]